MIDSDSLLRKLWNSLVSITALGTALIVPLYLIYEPLSPSTARLIGIIVPLIFLLDIIAEFNTSYFSGGAMIRDRKIIAGAYLRRWFIMDLIPVFPGLFLASSGLVSESTVIHILPVLHVLKMVKFNKLIRGAGGERINPALLRLTLLAFWILMAAHFISCAWIVVSGNPEGLPPTERYISSFYWTITTLTTIGFGDITPSGPNQTLFVIVIEIFGAAMYGLVIGNIAGLLANIDVAKTQFQEKLDRVKAFMKNRNLPGEMKKKINNYYIYLWETRHGYDEVTILDELPFALRESVALYLNKEIIEKVPLFEKAGDALLRDIIVNLRPIIFTPEDYVVRAGEIGDEMYFISRGQVEVLSADEQTVYATLEAGKFFGEISLLLSMPRTATIKAIQYCDLYCLDKATFDRIIERYPLFQESMRELAEKRKQEVEALVKQRKAENEAPPEPGKKEIESINAEKTGDGLMITWQGIEDAESYEIIKQKTDGHGWTVKGKGLIRPVWTDEEAAPVNSYRIRPVFADSEGNWSKIFKINADDEAG